MLEEHRANQNLWIYPPPIRVGYIFLCAAVMKITNLTNIKVIAYISSVFSILSLLVLALIGLRFTNRWITLCILLFMSTSPMDLAIARRAWQDSVVAFFSLLLIYFCCEMLLKIKNKIWYILFFIFGIYSLLIKDVTSLLIYGLLVIWLLWIISFKEKSFKGSLLFAFFSLLAPAISILIIGGVTGDIFSIFKVLGNMAKVVDANTYAVEYQNGPWYYFIHAFWILTPVCTFLSFVGIIGVIFYNYISKNIAIYDEKKRIIFTGFSFFMVALLSLLTIPQHLKNLRYASAVYGPFYLMGGLGIWHIASFFRSKLSKFYFNFAIGLIITSIIVTAVIDYQNFKRLFINKGVNDLVIRQFINAR